MRNPNCWLDDGSSMKPKAPREKRSEGLGLGYATAGHASQLEEVETRECSHLELDAADTLWRQTKSC